MTASCPSRVSFFPHANSKNNIGCTEGDLWHLGKRTSGRPRDGCKPRPNICDYGCSAGHFSFETSSTYGQDIDTLNCRTKIFLHVLSSIHSRL